MVKSNLIWGLFWRLNPAVRRLVWCTMLSGQRDPCGLSHSHTCSGTKSWGSNLLGWHLLQLFPAHAWSTWTITRQEGLPWYHHVNECGTGVVQSQGLFRAKVLRLYKMKLNTKVIYLCISFFFFFCEIWIWEFGLTGCFNINLLPLMFYFRALYFSACHPCLGHKLRVFLRWL